MFALRFLTRRWLGLLFCALMPCVSQAVEPPPCGLMGDGSEVESAPFQFSRASISYDVAASPDVQIRKIRNTGPDRSRLVLVFVSEGYTAAELRAGDFLASVKKVTDYMGQNAPWNKFLAMTNIYVIEIPSDEAGISHVVQGIEKNTYLEASYGWGAYERLITLSALGESRLNQIISGALGDVRAHAAVIVNDRQYGGSGGRYAVSALDQLPEVMTHELGHSIFGLADEYGGAASHYHGEAGPPNVDTALPPKWNHWIDDHTEMPTQAIVSSNEDGSVQLNSEIGAYEGGLGFDQGIYHPAVSCMMGNLTGFCSVCREAMVKKFFEMVPMASNIRRSDKTATIKIVKFPDLRAGWKICGKRVRAKSMGARSSIKIPKNKTRCGVQVAIEYRGDWVRGVRVRKNLFK